MLRGLGEGNAWPVAVRQAAEKIEQQAQTLKGKWDERKRHGARRRASVAAPAGADAGRGAADRPRDPLRRQADVDRGRGAARRRRRRDVRRVPQRRDRRRQHPLPPQGRQPRADRAGLSPGGSRRAPIEATARCAWITISDERLIAARRRHRRAPCCATSRDSRALDLELLAGADGLDRRITIPHTQKTGLALSGFDAYLRGGRVLVFGESEVRYLETLTADGRDGRRCAASSATICRACSSPAASTPPPELARRSRRARACRCCGPRTATPDAMSRLSAVLDTYLAARGIVHGVLMDILGLGVLVVGESGIGKSECALDLVVRGHRLVADDAVELRCRAQSFVIGTCPELTRHHMEIRGLGLINVQDLFGVASTRSSKRVELVVQLERWEHGREYDRLGLDDEFYEMLGIADPDDPDAGGAGPEHRDPGRSGRAQSAAALRAATTPRSAWSIDSTGNWRSRRSPPNRTLITERISSETAPHSVDAHSGM